MKASTEKTVMVEDEFSLLGSECLATQVIGGGFFSDVAGDLGDAASWAWSEANEHSTVSKVVGTGLIVGGAIGYAAVGAAVGFGYGVAVLAGGVSSGLALFLTGPDS